MVSALGPAISKTAFPCTNTKSGSSLLSSSIFDIASLITHWTTWPFITHVMTDVVWNFIHTYYIIESSQERKYMITK